MNCEELVELAGLRTDSGQRYFGGGTWDNAYWRTICADLYSSADTGTASNFTRASPEDRELSERWHDAACSGDVKKYLEVEGTQSLISMLC
jgi:hypothetical protein